MLAPFPHSAIINVPATVSGALLEAAEDLPLYDAKDFYSFALQSLVADTVRGKCTDAFDWLVDRINKGIARRPYCVLIRGLRFDRGNRLFIALNRAFGKMVALPYQEPRAQLVHHLQPRTDILSARGGREAERLHTDAADWGTPIRFISMVCVRPDPDGQGRSRLLDVDAVQEEVQTKLGRDSLELLKQPMPWQLHECWGGGLKWRPVLTESTVCWRRYTILLAVDVEGAEVSREMLGLLDEFEKVVEDSDHRIDFLMQEGELLFSDNSRGLHARTPIMDADDSRRLMIRSWIDTGDIVVMP
ncbi:MAG TPA: TauD/TfdA family dioxygenase [Pyrinomonadaceae bacterium]|nr:TauD/TfdA family dioxygenase [Pyrinomonadaceae bacterium]